MANRTSDISMPSIVWLGLRLFWIVYILTAGASLLIAWKYHSFFIQADSGVFSMPDPIAYGERLDAISLGVFQLNTIAFLGSVIGYIFFYHLSMSHCRILDPDQKTVSPTGMWLWYIVPIANLWKPVEGVSQVWRVLHCHADLPDTVPWAFTVWWGSWLIGAALVRLVKRIHPGSIHNAMPSNDFADSANFYLWSTPGTLLLMVSCIALWWISGQIYAAHKLIETELSEGSSAKA